LARAVHEQFFPFADRLIGAPVLKKRAAQSHLSI
jgi:hypothetical protein